MGKQRFGELTDALYRRLSGADAESLASLAILMCTVDADGWPHPAMLSYFEVAAIDRRTVRLAVYNDSGTCANLRGGGKATLVIVDKNLVCYVRGKAAEVAPVMAAAPFNAMLVLEVERVTFDEPPPDLEPDAVVTSGITYRARTGPPLAQARAILAELRAVTSGPS